jgi:hypothetical protein
MASQSLRLGGSLLLIGVTQSFRFKKRSLLLISTAESQDRKKIPPLTGTFKFQVDREKNTFLIRREETMDRMESPYPLTLHNL